MSEDPRHVVSYRLGDGSHWRVRSEVGGRHRAPGVPPVAVGDLADADAHLRRRGGTHPPRVAVVTDEARLGDEALAVLRRVAARSPDLRQQTEMRIKHCSSPTATVRDYVDLTRQCSPGSLAAAVDALADDPGCDAVVVTLGARSADRVRSLLGVVESVCRDHPDTTVFLVSATDVDPPSRVDA
jgi:hypothetical protein